MKCRFCEYELQHKFVDLVNCPPSNSFLSQAQLSEPEEYFPLTIYVCHNCFLVQVDEYKKAKDIFNKEYVYFSSFSKSWVEHARKYTDAMVQRFRYNEHSFVMEIASNDGYLLQHFLSKGIPVLGIEPTENTAAVALGKGIPTITEYFGTEFAMWLKRRKQKPDLIVGNNVLAHVPDIDDFVEGLKIALRKHGVITLEFPHLLRLIEDCQFDTIYHEHFSYLSFTTVKKIFEAHGLEMFDVEKWPTHGGSLRIFAKHTRDTHKEISPNVEALLQEEAAFGLNSLACYQNFQGRVDQVKNELLGLLLALKKAGKKVAGYGAAAKGNTLLNYAGIKGNDLIMFVVDASPHKQHKYLPGSHIPVCDEAALKAFKPDYIIIFPWNLKEEVMEQLAYTSEWGCQFITAIPKVQVHRQVAPMHTLAN